MTKTLRNIFSDRMREALSASSYTHRSLADELKIAPSTIQNWTSGKSWPSPETIESLAILFGVSPQWFFGKASGVSPLEAVEILVDFVKKSDSVNSSSTSLPVDISEALMRADESDLRSIRNILGLPIPKNAKMTS